MERKTEKQLTKQDVNLPQVNAWIPNQSDFAELRSMPCDFSLVTKYRTADDWAAIKDKELCCFYLGLTEITNDKEEVVVCGKFISEEGPFISGQMILIEAIKNLPVGTPMKIIYKGKKPNRKSEGSTMHFEIKTSASRISASTVQS